MSQIRRYYRKFQKVAGWLKLKTIITEEEYAKYFWQGIPRRTQARLETKYLAQYTAHDMKDPFEVAKLITMLEKMYARDRFDAEDTCSDSGSESDEEEDSDSDSSTDSDYDSSASADTDASSKSDKEKSKKHQKKEKKSKKDRESAREVGGERPERKKTKEKDDNPEEKLKDVTNSPRSRPAVPFVEPVNEGELI